MKFTKLKSKAFLIEEEIYSSKVFVVFNEIHHLKELLASHCSEEEADVIIKDFGPAKEYGAKTLTLENGHCVMHFPSTMSDNRMHGVISHECLHAAHSILDNVGMKLSFDTDEAYCYLLGFLVKKIYEQI